MIDRLLVAHDTNRAIRLEDLLDKLLEQEDGWTEAGLRVELESRGFETFQPVTEDGQVLPWHATIGSLR